jgi:hypothetical protein
LLNSKKYLALAHLAREEHEPLLYIEKINHRVKKAGTRFPSQKHKVFGAVEVQNVKPLYFLSRSFETIYGKRT